MCLSVCVCVCVHMYVFMSLCVSVRVYATHINICILTHLTPPHHSHSPPLHPPTGSGKGKKGTPQDHPLAYGQSLPSSQSYTGDPTGMCVYICVCVNISYSQSHLIPITLLYSAQHTYTLTILSFDRIILPCNQPHSERTTSCRTRSSLSWLQKGGSGACCGGTSVEHIQ